MIPESASVFNTFITDGVAVSFDTTIKAEEDDEFLIYLGDDTQLGELQTEYEVSGFGGNVNITFDEAPATGRLYVYRVTGIKQETSIKTSFSFPVESIEAQLDRLTKIAKELKYQTDRSLKTTEVNTPVVGAAGAVFALDENGQPVMGPTVTAIEGAQQAALDAAAAKGAAEQAAAAAEAAAVSVATKNGATPGLSRAQSSLSVIVTVGDSLTAGSGGFEPITALANSLRATFGYGGLGYRDLKLGDMPTFAYSGGWGSSAPSGGVGGPAYSMNFGGVGIATIPSSGTSVTFGPEANWHTCRLYYLKQPGGGGFRVKHADQASSNYLVEAATADAAVGVGWVDIDRGAVGGDTLAIIYAGIDGPVWLIGADFRASGGGPVIVKMATGGKKAADFVAQDEVTWSAIMADLAPDLVMVNLGMNDRLVSTGAEIVDLVDQVVERCPVGADILLIAPSEASDESVSSLPSYRTLAAAYASENGYGFVNNAEILGSYATAVARGYMNDTVHPNGAGQSLISMNYARFLGVPASAPPSPVPEYDGGGGGGGVVAAAYDLTPRQQVLVGPSATVDLWEIGLTNGSPTGILEIDIYSVRSGTSNVKHRVYRLRVSNTTAVGVVTAIGTLSMTEDFSDTPSAGAAGLYTLSAAIVSDRLLVSVTEADGVNLRLTALARIVFPVLTIAGTPVIEYE